MTYTPINWQTGDTITAAGMNRMDNGWGVQSSQLFSETVTTTEVDGGVIMGTLVYASTIDADTITVTFDGTDYECERLDAFSEYFYGGFGESGPDFTDYPFALESNPHGGPVNIYTGTAGTHTVAVTIGQSMEVSDDFSAAVNAVAPLPFRCIAGETTYSDMAAARGAGRLLYFYSDTNMHIVNTFSEIESATAVAAVPEGVENIETYGFEDVDGTLTFAVFTY